MKTYEVEVLFNTSVEAGYEHRPQSRKEVVEAERVEYTGFSIIFYDEDGMFAVYPASNTIVKVRNREKS